ncbi:MAG: hypothetical protein P8P48_04005, partial [Saprospiraceae bacterium]|nr:hypothetical protein [Saprospiraceae bacterium]
QCLKILKPQFFYWGFLFLSLILCYSCKKDLHPSPNQATSTTKTNDKEAIQKIKDLAVNQALEDALIISWEDRQHKTNLSNDDLIIVKTSCKDNQSKKDNMHCVLLSTLFAYPNDKGQLKLCLTLASHPESLTIDSSFCMAIFTNPPVYNNEYLNQKADSFLLTNDPMAMASFMWNSLEWIYFLSYLKDRVNSDHTETLNNYFRFSDTDDPYIFRYYANLRSAF